jgi:hypothetical protein
MIEGFDEPQLIARQHDFLYKSIHGCIYIKGKPLMTVNHQYQKSSQKQGFKKNLSQVKSVTKQKLNLLHTHLLNPTYNFPKYEQKEPPLYLSNNGIKRKQD